jgi:hypothetical protein
MYSKKKTIVNVINNKPLANLTKWRRERPKSIKSEMKKGAYPQILVQRPVNKRSVQLP